MMLWKILEVLFIIIAITLALFDIYDDYNKAERERNRELARKKQLDRLNSFGIPVKELSREGYIDALATLGILGAWRKEHTPKKPIRSPYAGLAPWVILHRFIEDNLDNPEVILQEFNRLKLIQAKLDRLKENN
ncbi:hypothetical protein OFO12_05275 [Campylobacter sp. JMF_04 NA10]|uniref:hypothetical protein n=1 Tax=Campylobacter sp. JMF_04 NA10 TaxID=2983824 RepID=UPI0022E9CB0C|nr:hypothetical protein [Campylobacter sp. JMF_04 NA10]MDA3076784.1 hypothetical protein [Campylobacter sp. JMF_04 NA10]